MLAACFDGSLAVAAPRSPSTEGLKRGSLTRGVHPSTASGIVRTLWDRRERALAKRDVSAFARFEEGAALRYDQAFTKNVRCGCVAPKEGHAILSVNVVVPRSTKPQAFLATVKVETTTANQPGGFYRLVVVPGKLGWQLAIISFDDQGERARSRTTTRHGYAYPRRRTPRRGALIAAFARNHHTLADSFIPERKHPSTHRWSVIGPAFTFALNRKDSIECGAVRSHTSVRAVPGVVLIQKKNRNQYGRDVPPGRYHSVTYTAEQSLCLTTVKGSEVSAAYGFGFGGFDDTTVATTYLRA